MIGTLCYLLTGSQWMTGCSQTISRRGRGRTPSVFSLFPCELKKRYVVLIEDQSSEGGDTKEPADENSPAGSFMYSFLLLLTTDELSA
jgi:hypothetical protein